MRATTTFRPLAACALGGVLLAAGAFIGGRASTGARVGVPVGAVALLGGVPVGVGHSPAGALAAADNYVAWESETLEQQPGLYAQLLRSAFTPAAARAAAAQAAQIRATDAINVGNYRAGGRALAIIGARRLERYSPSTATVTTWLGGFVWGPHLAPRQTWQLVETTLRWQAGRWLVGSSAIDPQPAPVPSMVVVDGANNRTRAFNERLAGMRAPLYAAG